MTTHSYQALTETTAIYPEVGSGSPAAINYTLLGLLGEAGEMANKWKKYYRDGLPLEDVKKILEDELGDAMWYIARLSAELGISLETLMNDNIAKLKSRKERNVLNGNGDNR